MIPKEKAYELKYEKFGNFAELAVDEIIIVLEELDMYEHVPQHLMRDWKEVKEELKKLE